MAKARTVSALCLTNQDKHVLETCQSIAEALADCANDAPEFIKTYGRIHDSRDAGVGVSGGKLQRDALCTRGRTGKAPYSNRNLRWHPLVVATKETSFAKPIERLQIHGEEELVFIIEENGIPKEYPAPLAHEIPSCHAVLPEHWFPHIELLRAWGDGEWTANSCVIPAYEYSDWQDAVLTYAKLGLMAACVEFGGQFDEAYNAVVNVLEQNQIPDVQRLSRNADEFTKCPVCRKGIKDSLAVFREEPRGSTWNPEWGQSKKTEGDDEHTQLIHLNPLVESEIRHKVDNVFWGHRWCNVAMTDHSLSETLNFMEYIVKAHGRRN